MGLETRVWCLAQPAPSRDVQGSTLKLPKIGAVVAISTARF